MKDALRLFHQPELQSPALVVGWTLDTSRLGPKVTDYLNRKLGGQGFAEIEPVEFFPLGGVTIENDLVQFPESRFYACPEKDLVIFESTPPSYEYYQFFSLVLDAAEQYNVREVYTIGGMISISAHTVPRDLIGVFNSLELKQDLSHYDIAGEMDYETPPGQRPTLNSFFCWAAGRRNIPAVNLWVPVPFYLVAVEDPKAQRCVLEFFDRRFDLQIDFSDLDEEIRRQEQKIAGLRNRLPDIDESIRKLESQQGLSDEDGQRLVQEMEELLGGKKG